MKNYDGPAYYRWRDKQPKLMKQSTTTEERPSKVKPSMSKPRSQNKVTTSSNLAARVRKFEPKTTEHNNGGSKELVEFFDRQRSQRNSFYEMVIERLRLDNNDLILFDDDNSTTDLIDLDHLEKSVEKNSELLKATVNEPELSERSESIDQETSNTEQNEKGGLGKSFSTIVGGEDNHNESLPFFAADNKPVTATADEKDADSTDELSDIDNDDVDKKTDVDVAAISTPSVPVSSTINQRFQNPLESKGITAAENETAAMDSIKEPEMVEEVVTEVTNSDQDPVINNEDEIEVQQQPSQTTEVELNHNESSNHVNLVEPVKGYVFPSMDLLNPPITDEDDSVYDWVEHQVDTLDQTLKAFGVDGEVVDWTNGPTVTQFQVKLALGVKVQRIVNLRDDLKLALAAKDVRIEAPIPGKSTVGIEIPNATPRPVTLSEVIDTAKFADKKSPLTTAVGVDISGRPQVTDIRKMPHGLIAGATGSGKSVFINSLLVSILYKANPAEVKLLLIDPKAVELAPYDGIPHLLSPVISDPQEAAASLKWVTKEMDERYEKLSAAGVRNIEQFNEKAEEQGEFGLKMPYILVIIDELADLMMVASNEIQDYIVRITQKARAAGIHLIVATQRPSVDIVTGTIKNNIPTRIAFMVSSQVDSRTIIDTSGAETLLGKGDLLYLGNGSPQPVRLQGAYVTNEELENVVNFVRQQGQPNYMFTPDSLKKIVQTSNEDELMPEVLEYIAKEDTVSTSKLQRLFSIGYNRAANIIDTLESHHYISEQHGSKPREVYYHNDESIQTRN